MYALMLFMYALLLHRLFIRLCSRMPFHLIISGVTGSLCSSADVYGFVDALPVVGIAVVKWSLAKVQSGRWLHLLSSAPSFITSSQPHLSAFYHSYTSLLPSIILLCSNDICIWWNYSGSVHTAVILFTVHSSMAWKLMSYTQCYVSIFFSSRTMSSIEANEITWRLMSNIFNRLPR